MSNEASRSRRAPVIRAMAFAGSVALLACAPVSVLGATVISVPGEATVHFAGQTQSGLESSFPPSGGAFTVPWDVGGAGNHGNFHNDTADWEGVVRAENNAGAGEGFDIADRTAASTIPPSVDVAGLSEISITASGSWAHGALLAHTDADGRFDTGPQPTHGEYDDLGISLIISARLNALIGVFLDDDPPDAGATPASLTVGVSDMKTPVLQQTFLIGSSLDCITVPSGATRLFFGLHNGFEWWNNDGDMEVTMSSVEACCDSTDGSCYMADSTCCSANGDSPGGSSTLCSDPVVCCGDGIVRVGVEECDDGVDNSDTEPDACRSDCSLPRCGDGVQDTGEECDVVQAIGGGPPICLSTCKLVDEPVPAVSEWGLIVMGLMGLTIGTILYGRRRVAA